MYKVRAINFGWYRRRHGILLENLPPSKQKLILDHDHMKWLDSDVQAFEVIFKIEDQNDHERITRKVFWNPFQETFTSIKDVEKDSGLVDWNCAICDNPIKSRMTYKKAENFVCSNCQEAHNSKNRVIDQRIIDSSNKFMKQCKKMLKKEQREFLNYAKKTSKS